jgi:hypothetical protein
MRADAAHPEQVRELLEQAAAIVTDARQRTLVETVHRQVVELVEQEWSADQLALQTILAELAER